MIVASFLTKDLLIDWRWGERHFMRELVDGDLAANNGGWQWAASTGTDAQPWFRIFNPTSQGERFDPDGDYVRRWVPELARVPARWIHQPWELPGRRGHQGRLRARPDLSRPRRAARGAPAPRTRHVRCHPRVVGIRHTGLALFRPRIRSRHRGPAISLTPPKGP